jgi:hypothetical protein
VELTKLRGKLRGSQSQATIDTHTDSASSHDTCTTVAAVAKNTVTVLDSTVVDSATSTPM